MYMKKGFSIDLQQRFSIPFLKSLIQIVFRSWREIEDIPFFVKVKLRLFIGSKFFKI